MNSNIYVSFIILTWNSEKYIDHCLASIDKLNSFLRLEILVVDNGSNDKTLEKLGQFKSLANYVVKIISLEKNIGTTTSRNLAIKESKGQILVFIDSDVEFNSYGFEDMVNYLMNNKEIGILAPRIEYPNGNIQHSCKKFPTLNVKLLKLIDIFTRFSISNRDYYFDFPFSNPTEVDTAISAFWLMKSDIIDLVGYLDETRLARYIFK